MIQGDDPKCRDEFPNCQMVLKSKLCGYHYYNENCCQSCRMISNEISNSENQKFQVTK